MLLDKIVGSEDVKKLSKFSQKMLAGEGNCGIPMNLMEISGTEFWRKFFSDSHLFTHHAWKHLSSNKHPGQWETQDERFLQEFNGNMTLHIWFSDKTGDALIAGQYSCNCKPYAIFYTACYCLHDYKEVPHSKGWNCWHEYECRKCGDRYSVDSSD